MARYILYTLFMLAVLSPLHVAAYPNGKVESSCSSMLPSHGTSAQTSSAPYSLVLPKYTYSAGEKIKVTLSTRADRPSFTGFLIQARSGNSTTPLGSFEDALSHMSKSAKSVLQFTWVAPTSNAGDIQLRATVVKVKMQYWTDIFSSKLSYVAPSTTNTPVSTDEGSTVKGSTSEGSTSKQSTSVGSTSRQSTTSTTVGTNKEITSEGSTSKGSKSEGSTSKGSTSEGSTSKGSSSEGTTSKPSTSVGSTSIQSTSKGSSNRKQSYNRGFQFSVSDK
uniref:Reelin domain-containing protein n=1 Tax=Leptobrachium leishanense TaxID=445787 RepID=A0A8C5WFM0_9ANUR